MFCLSTVHVYIADDNKMNSIKQSVSVQVTCFSFMYELSFLYQGPECQHNVVNSGAKRHILF